MEEEGGGEETPGGGGGQRNGEGMFPFHLLPFFLLPFCLGGRSLYIATVSSTLSTGEGEMARLITVKYLLSAHGRVT